MNNTKQIFLSLATFVMLMWGGAAHSQTVYDIDRQIRDVRARITDTRQTAAKHIRVSLRRNPDYRYVMEHRANVEELRRKNEELITLAHQQMCAKYSTSIIPRGAFLFILYSRELSNLRELYDINNTKIKKYERHRNACQVFETGVRNHFDSIMHADIDRYQLMIDSLLNKKYELIR